MKRLLLVFIISLAAIALISSARVSSAADEQNVTPTYRLLWSDNFNGSELDSTKWSKIDRVKDVEWAKYMSSNESLFRMKNGYLRLYAIHNNGIEPNDTAPFLTAGISTRHKQTIKYGKIEVRARIKGAQGCWPAIWTKADDVAYWKYPERPEIDIIEHYNYDDDVVQTIHSNYTDVLKHTADPQSSCRPKIKKNRFNTYAVEMLPDRIILSVNGVQTLVYPRIEKNSTDWQFPFTVDEYLMIDMQVGNKYLKVDKTTYPAYMDIDWVRFYEWVNE